LQFTPIRAYADTVVVFDCGSLDHGAPLLPRGLTNLAFADA
jgi:hypothetical protein